jgi:hypothetical protein
LKVRADLCDPVKKSKLKLTSVTILFFRFIGAPFTEVEEECAEQMRRIVSASHIPYSSLIDSPETLLRCSKGHCKLVGDCSAPAPPLDNPMFLSSFSLAATNGALWTRFTVQFNLFAGSIVALGSDEQRKKLVASQVCCGN